MQKLRNSNIELLRIISIMMIVLGHYTVHNGIENYMLPLGFNRYILEISSLGNFGTIIFVIITGYYLSKERAGGGINLNKLLKLYLQIIFYSLGIYILLVIFRIEPFSIKELIKSSLPITFNQYWFASVYFIIYIFHSYINVMLNNLTRKKHLIFIMIGIFIFSILQTITTKSYYCNQLIEFILFYSIGSYFSKYEDNLINKNNIKFLLISIITLLLSVLLLDIIGLRKIYFAKHSIHLFSRHSFIAILFSTSLFSIFATKKEYSNKLINTISSCVFGVYLISDNNFIRKLLWIDLFKNANYVLSNYLILHIIVSLISTIFVCLIIEYIRKNVIDKMYDKYIKRFVDIDLSGL